jgi:hypothetical protein
VFVTNCGDRAIQLHPQESGLYIMGAAHELDQMSVTGARTLLQRGIRINGDSMDLWKEYVKMEMGFIERLRRRWEVLGVEMETEEVMSGGIVQTVITNAVQGEMCFMQLNLCLSDCLYSHPWTGFGTSDLWLSVSRWLTAHIDGPLFIST